MTRLTGGCHCGRVRFSANTPEAPRMLDCNCSICTKTGHIHLFVPHEDFDLEAEDGALTSYRFGSEQADHLFCETCGIKSFYQPRSHPDCWSVNARCLDGDYPPGAHIEKFDGRNWERNQAQLSE